MDKKICCMCKNDLPLDSFKSNSRRSDGLQSQCIECQKKYRRKHYLNNKAKYINKAKKKTHEVVAWWKDYKSQFKCSRCPEDHPACIQFHHADDNKNGNVSGLIRNGSRESILKEIEKCVPLCANCHAKEHWNAGVTQLAE